MAEPSVFHLSALVRRSFVGKLPTKIRACCGSFSDSLTFASPGAFEAKNLDTTLEVEALELTVWDGLFDLVLGQTEVSRLQDKSWMKGSVTMPIFQVNHTCNAP